MSEETYYLRFRGIVSGPYDLAGLRALRRHGQLSSFHEISPDGTTWLKASTLATLFEPPPPRRRAGPRVEPSPAAPPSSTHESPSLIELLSIPNPFSTLEREPDPRPVRDDRADEDDEDPLLIPDTGLVPWPEPEPVALVVSEPTSIDDRPQELPADPTLWYYAENGQPGGPIGTERLRELADAGRIGPRTLVWREGLDGWVACEETGAVDFGAAGQVVGTVPEREASCFLPAAPPSRAERMATASLWLGLLGWTCGVGSLLAIILGALALGPLAGRPEMERARVRARDGLVLGALGLAFDLLLVLVLMERGR